MKRQPLLRDRGGFWPLLAVTTYVFGGYVGGLSLLLPATQPWGWVAGTLLTPGSAERGWTYPAVRQGPLERTTQAVSRGRTMAP